jgi:hypothetical protein
VAAVGRREAELDPDGPLHEFALALRALRSAAGAPSYRELAHTARYSQSVLAAAASGHTLPTWDVTRAYVAACGGDVGEWRERWERAAQSARPAARAVPEQSEHPEQSVAQQEQQQLPTIMGSGASTDASPRIRRPRRRTTVFVGGGVALATIAALGIYELTTSSTPTHPAAATHTTSPSLTPPPTTAESIPPDPADENNRGVVEPRRRVGSAVLVPGHEIDLDSRAADWGDRAGYPHSPEDLEFTLAHHTLVGEEYAVLGLLPPGTVGTRKACGLLEGYGDPITPKQIKAGIWFCVQTDQNRYALVYVTNVLLDGSTGLPVQVSMDITVWDPTDAQNAS